MHRTVYAVALALAAGSLVACSGDTGQTAATAPATPSASWSFSPPRSLPATPSARPPSIAPSPEPGPSAAAITPTGLPVGFLGSWNMDRAACGTESEGRLTVEPRRITFYESSGPITTVSRNGDIVTITATLTGEGTTWEETMRFTLSADGTTLTNLSTDTVRYRCP